MTLKIDDKDYRPIRKGTKFVVRQASLSGVANRYVDLQMPPGDSSTTGNFADGAIVPATETQSAVDLDQLFNTFDAKTRKGLQHVITGSAKQFQGTGEAARIGFHYLNPSIASSTQLFQELSRDTPALRRYIVRSSDLVGDLASKRNDLTGLVNNLERMNAAIAKPPNALASAVTQLPPFMRRANTTFVNLRSTLDHVDPLVAESKPVAKKLRPFLAALRPFARDSVPTVRDLSALIRRKGASNDLVELMRGAPPLAKITVGTVNRNGKNREGAFPASTKALAGGHARARLRAPLRRRPDRLVRRLQPLGRVRRQRRLLARAAHPLRAVAAAERHDPLDPGAAAQGALRSTVTTGQYDKCPGAAARPSDGSTPTSRRPTTRATRPRSRPGK